MPEPIRNVWARIRRYVIHYAYALAASSWNAGVATAVASLGLAAAAAIDPEHVRALDWAQMLGAFKYGAVINGLFYLRSHPLPEKLPLGGETNPPIPAP